MNTGVLKSIVCQLFEFGEDKWFDYEDEFIALSNRIENAERNEILKALRKADDCGCGVPCDCYSLGTATHVVKSRPGYKA